MDTNDTLPECDFRCNGGGGCVMVDKGDGWVRIWDSCNPYGPRLKFTKKEYRDFRRRVIDDSRHRMVLRFLTSAVRVALVGLRWFAS